MPMDDTELGRGGDRIPTQAVQLWRALNQADGYSGPAAVFGLPFLSKGVGLGVNVEQEHEPVLPVSTSVPTCLSQVLYRAFKGFSGDILATCDFCCWH